MPLEYRFTPTHVGTTMLCLMKMEGVPVHPHTRGDHNYQEFYIEDVAGSPPHTWGPPPGLLYSVSFLRFTPTHVGTTLCAM